MAKTKATYQPSSAMVLVKLVWAHNREGTGFSWTRLNGSMFSAVKLAIKAGMRFNRDDFIYMRENMRMGYWCGADRGERWYSLAVELGHPTAYLAYEAWRGRLPMIFEGQRLFVGRQIHWAGECWNVSSFREPTRKNPVQVANLVQREFPEYGRVKVTKRLKLTREQLLEHRRGDPKEQAKRLTAKERKDAKRIVEQKRQELLANPRWYKVLMDGCSFHGGSLKWSLPRQKADGSWKPGNWHEIEGSVQICNKGLHITALPGQWYSREAEVFEVEVFDQTEVERRHALDKVAVKKCRLLRKVEGAELRAVLALSD